MPTTERDTTKSGTAVSLPPLHETKSENLHIVNVNSAVQIQTLVNENIVKINDDGTISFSAQTNQPIQYSYATKDNKATKLQTVDGISNMSNLHDGNGFSLETTQGLTSPSDRNVYLTFGRDINKFRIDIDGKIYIIERSKLEEIKNGKSNPTTVASLYTNESGASGSSTADKPIVSSKYPGLENLKISPNGEVQFSISTDANNMLVHYARYDGSKSLSGYDTIFRHNDHYNPNRPFDPYNTRLTGATHQDKTFSLKVDHLDSRTVKVDFTLDKNVKDASVRMGNIVYPVNTDEMRRHIIEEAGKAREARAMTGMSGLSGDAGSGGGGALSAATTGSSSNPLSMPSAMPIASSATPGPVLTPTLDQAQRIKKEAEKQEKDTDRNAAGALGAVAANSSKVSQERKANEVKQTEFNKKIGEIAPVERIGVTGYASGKWEGFKKWASEKLGTEARRAKKAELVLEDARKLNLISTSSGEPPPVIEEKPEAEKTSPPESTEETKTNTKFNIAEAAAVDVKLMAEQARLARMDILSEVQKARLSEVISQRAQLALNAKAAFEADIVKASSPESVAEAKKGLYETWASKIENSLGETEKARFVDERVNHETNSALEKTKFKSSEVKTAQKSLNEVLKAGGASETDAHRAECKLRETQLESAKLQELLLDSALSEAVKAQLEFRRTVSLYSEVKELGKLASTIETELSTATGKNKPALDQKLIEVNKKIATIQTEIDAIHSSTLSAEAIAMEIALNDARINLDNAKAEYQKDPTTENKGKLHKAEIEVRANDVAKADMDIKVQETKIANHKQYIEALDEQIKTADKKTKAVLEDDKKANENKIKAAEKTIEGGREKRLLLQERLTLANQELELHKAQNPPSGAVDKNIVDTLQKEVAARRVEVGNMELARAANIKAQASRMKALATRELTKVFDNKFSRNPMRSLLAIAAVHAAIDAAEKSDMDPNAAHTVWPSIFANITEEGVPYWRLSSYQTTSEMSETEARSKDVLVAVADTTLSFGQMMLCFHFLTGQSTSGHFLGRITIPNAYMSTLGKTRLGGFVGNLTGKIATPAILIGASAYAGYHSTSGGQFIEGDREVFGPVTGDHLDIGIPTIGNIIMGSAWYGPQGAVVLVAAQTAGAFYGIDVALERLDRESKASLIKRGLFHSVNIALSRGFYLPEEGDRVENSPSYLGYAGYTPEQKGGIDDLAMGELYSHMMNNAQRTDSAKVPFLGKTLELSRYTPEELQQLGIAVKGDINGKQYQAYNYDIISGFFSTKKVDGAANTPLVGGILGYYDFGTTALESIKDEKLRNKVIKDIAKVREWYADIYDKSLRLEYDTHDNSSTREQFWSKQKNYFCVYWSNANFLTSHRVRDTSGDNLNGELNSTVDRVNHMENYAKALSDSSEFKNQVVGKISPDSSRNMFEVLEPLKKFYPGLEQMFESENSYDLLKYSYATYEINERSGKLQKTDKFYSFGDKLVEFREYTNSLQSNAEFQTFVEDVRDPSKSLFINGIPDPRFELFFPGISRYLLLDDPKVDGFAIIETMLGKENYLSKALNVKLELFRREFIKIDDDIIQEILGDAKTNRSKLENLVNSNEFEGRRSGFYSIEGLNVETKSDGTGLVEPAGMRLLDSSGWAFVRSFRNKDGKIISGILIVRSDDIAQNSDDFIKLVTNSYVINSKDGSTIFNTSSGGTKENIANVDITSSQVRSDGSVLMYGHDHTRGLPFSYILTPHMQEGRLVWKKDFAHEVNGRIVRGAGVEFAEDPLLRRK